MCLWFCLEALNEQDLNGIYFVSFEPKMQEILNFK
jgi:hypothetical protein